MATTTIDAECNARPTRLAFILPDPDPDKLLTAIAKATNLWGGILNPIVIPDDSTRQVKGWHEERHAKDGYLKEQANLLKAFDPDRLITFSKDNLPDELKEFQHRTFFWDVLEWNPWNRGVISYFVDVWPLYQELWEKEVKGHEKHAFECRFVPKSVAEHSPFLSARFGIYENNDVYEFMTKTFHAEAITYDKEFKASYMGGKYLTPLNLTAQHCGGFRQPLHSHAYFLMNPEDMFDIVDYWNMRASGMYVLPLSLSDYKDFENPIIAFAADGSYPINDTVTNQVDLIKARSISDDEAKDVTDWINALALKGSICMMGWVPLYGGRELDIEPPRGFEDSIIGVLNDGYGSIRGPVPEFLGKRHHSQYWSMDLKLNSYGDANSCYRLPWLNKGCDALVDNMIGMGSGLAAARVSKEGLVTQHDSTSGSVSILPINAIQVVTAFLSGKDIRFLKTSAPGLVLVRIIEMFEGLRGSDLFKNEAIRKLLDELGTGKSRVAGEVRGALNRSLAGLQEFGQPVSREQIARRVDSILDQAVDAKVLRIGLEFQCSRCNQHNWYAVTEFDENYNCKSCFAHEKTPRLDATKWHYASDGFFRTSNKLDGNITILLALNWFHYLFDHDLKYAPSFDYLIDGEPHEMDFGIISAERFRGPVETIFGESKSGMALKEEERNKLRSFAEKTGSYICFCTLEDRFAETDKAFFRELMESKLRTIILDKHFLEMDYIAMMKYENDNRIYQSRTKTDWLMRVTNIRTLGKEFCGKHNIWA